MSKPTGTLTFLVNDDRIRYFITGALFELGMKAQMFKVVVDGVYIKVSETTSKKQRDEIIDCFHACLDYIQLGTVRRSAIIDPPIGKVKPEPSSLARTDPFDKMSRRMVCAGCDTPEKAMEPDPCLGCEGAGSGFQYPKEHESGRYCNPPQSPM